MTDSIPATEEQLPDLPFESPSKAPSTSAADPNPAKTVAELAARLFLPVTTIEDLLWILETKRSLILSGPPGAGKTFAARQIASYWAGQHVDFVQFHPSYSYEYFVSGYRPNLDFDHGLSYVLEPGPLLAAASRAMESPVRDGTDPTSREVLIIDEINRANVSSVFGELLSAMEDRGQSVRLQYGFPVSGGSIATHFEVPENFYFIATMNQADRSIGNFDAALRRRFGAYECSPMREPFSLVLPKYLEANHAGSSWIADWISEINQALPDPDFAIGASYFFNRPNLLPEDVRRIYEFEVLPFLRGRFSAETLASNDVFTFREERATAKTSAVAPPEPDSTVDTEQ